MVGYHYKGMRLLGGIPGQQVFAYRSIDAQADVRHPGYFNKAIDEYGLSSGDMILAVMGEPGEEVPAFYVARINGGLVTLGVVVALTAGEE